MAGVTMKGRNLSLNRKPEKDWGPSVPSKNLPTTDMRTCHLALPIKGLKGPTASQLPTSSVGGRGQTKNHVQTIAGTVCGLILRIKGDECRISTMLADSSRKEVKPNSFFISIL
jgi:hypothetical protein